MIMSWLKNISKGFLKGLWDSLKGVAVLFYIDNETPKEDHEKSQRMKRRSPSPIPSSAAAMYAEELERKRVTMKRINPNDRTMEKKNEPTEPSKLLKENTIAKQFLKCCALNGCCTLMSITVYENILIPGLMLAATFWCGKDSEDLNALWGWLQPIIYSIFVTFWIFPLFIVNKLVSSIWFTKIANKAYEIRKGKPSSMPSMSKALADFVFNVVVQTLFLIEIYLVNFLPFPYYVVYFLRSIHMCFMYSLYAFEYKWYNMTWELHHRLSYIELHWPYFLGFGLPLTVLTSISSSVIKNGCIFAIFFPIFILSGNDAKQPDTMTDTPLRLFSPVIFASNMMFGGRKVKVPANRNAQPISQEQQQQQQQQQQQKQHHQYYNQHQQILLKKQQEQMRLRRSSSKESLPSVHTQTQFRYPQPPQTITPGRSTPERQLRPEFIRTQKRYSEGRILIPTPVAGSIGSRLPSTTGSTQTNQRR